MKIRLADTYVRPDENPRNWDRLEALRAAALAEYEDGYSAAWYVPPALRPRGAQLERRLLAIRAARVKYGKAVLNEIEIADWVHAPLYDSITVGAPRYGYPTIPRKHKKGWKYAGLTVLERGQHTHALIALGLQPGAPRPLSRFDRLLLRAFPPDAGENFAKAQIACLP